MLDRIGCGDAGAEIAERWNELVKLSKESSPQRYELAYPDELLAQLTEFFYSQCRRLGMRQFDPGVRNDAPVSDTVNDAWREFRVNPGTFDEYERTSLAALLKSIQRS